MKYQVVYRDYTGETVEQHFESVDAAADRFHELKLDTSHIEAGRFWGDREGLIDAFSGIMNRIDAFSGIMNRA